MKSGAALVFLEAADKEVIAARSLYSGSGQLFHCVSCPCDWFKIGGQVCYTWFKCSNPYEKGHERNVSLEDKEQFKNFGCQLVEGNAVGAHMKLCAASPKAGGTGKGVSISG